MIEPEQHRLTSERRLDLERAVMPFLREKLKLYETFSSIKYNETLKEFTYIMSPEVQKDVDAIDEIVKMLVTEYRTQK